MPDTRDWDPGHIIDIIAHSAHIAMKHYDAPNTEVKSDRSLVTRADHEIESYLESELEATESGSYLIGEETIATHDERYVEAALSEVGWVIDPIDGTAPYAHHIPTWGISIARMEAGVLTDGAIYLPVTDELFLTTPGGVEYGPIAGPRRILSHETRIPDAQRRRAGMIAVTQGIAKGHGIDVPNPVQALGCAVLPLTYLLLDRYVCYLGKVKLWDCAAALPMLRWEGFVTELADGSAIGLEVSKTHYRLDEGDRDRWKLRDRLICGSSRELVDSITGAVLTGR